MIVLVIVKSSRNKIQEIAAIKINTFFEIKTSFKCGVKDKLDFLLDDLVDTSVYGTAKTEEISQEECIRRFNDWLDVHDRIYCWDSQTKATIEAINTTTADGKVRVVSNDIANRMRYNAKPPENIFEVAKYAGIIRSIPKEYTSQLAIKILLKLTKSVRYDFPDEPAEDYRADARAPGKQGPANRRNNSFDQFHGINPVVAVFSPERAASLPADPDNKPAQIAKDIMGIEYSFKQAGIIGKCVYKMHPGLLTKEAMDQHKCLEKKCPYLVKNLSETYWRKYYQIKKIDNENRTIKAIKQEEKNLRIAEMDSLREVFQSYADELDLPFEIVRVERDKAHYNKYRILYVSDNDYFDAQEYPEFVRTVNFFFPDDWLELRHIRDVDGHFVTIDEYYARRKEFKYNNYTGE